MSLNQQVKTRAAKESDANFILSTWLKSYRESDFAKSIPNEIYFSFHQTLINRILTNENTALTILCTPEDEDQILGYIVYNTKAPIIFFTYIKYTFRRLGFGNMLFSAVKADMIKTLNLAEQNEHGERLLIMCTHKFKMWGRIAAKYGLVYNPYIIGE